MTITLASLIARLTADVPAVSGVPTDAQYQRSVIDAVADLSRRASVPRRATISVLAGVASYDLPGDFQALIRLSAIGAPFGSSSLDYGRDQGYAWQADPRGGVLVSGSGLVPFSAGYREQITVSGNQLTIYPTPQTSADRVLLYAAGDALISGEYASLTDDRASVALLLASATCLERIAMSPAGQALKLTAGNDTVDFSALSTGLRAQAAGLRGEYLAAIQSLNTGSGGLG